MNSGPARILIVDDTEADRLATRFLLEHSRSPGYVIQEVDQADLTAASCERFQPDCVLLDFRLPDGDGLSLLQQLRQRFGPLQFAVVLVTGSGHELLAVRALTSGAQDYIPKAFLSAELLERAIQNSLHKLSLERQKHAAEEALAANERKLRAVIDAAPSALYTVNLTEGRALYISSVVNSLTGYTAEELDRFAGPGILNRIHPEDRSDIQSHVRKLQLAAAKEILECQFRFQHKDGTWRWLLIRDRVLAPGLMAGAASDVSHRRQMEDELHSSQQQLLAAQGAAGIGTWSWDVSSEQMDCSPLFLELYGRAGQAPVSASIWSEWLHPDDRERIKVEVSLGLKGEPFLAEFRVLWPDGSVHWLRSQGKLSQAPGRPPRFLGANLEITGKKKTEEELRRSNEDLERFAYIASHDLQEPLRTILSFSELFARRHKDLDQESKQFLDFVRQGGQRMQALITDLLNFSRVTQADQEPFEQIDCNEVLAEALAGLQTLVRESGAQIDIDRLPTVKASFTLLTHLFQNLLGNGLKYRSQRTPVVKVTASKTPAGWQFCVADNGIGFDMVYAERIFEAFKRLHSRDEYQGTGLGLAICKRIVERHGGRIWAESVLGAGSEFYFTIADSAAT